jgi:hypothetical protein
VEAHVRDVAVLAMIALLMVAMVQVMLLSRHRRQLEARLGRANANLDVMRRRLAEATRPPTQFARMRLREEALYRFGRLRRAVPRRSRPREVAEPFRDAAR